MRPGFGIVAVLLALLACDAVKNRLSGDDENQGKASAEASASAAAPKAPAGDVVPAPKTNELPQLAVGQWTKHELTDKAGKKSTLTYKVVGKRGDDQYWLEVATQPGTVMQILLKLKDRHDPKSSDIRVVRIRMPGGRVRELKGPVLDMTRAKYKEMIGNIFVPSLEGLPREKVTVPAGTFEGCFVHSQQVTMFGISAHSKIHNHPAVPITGMVRSEPVKDGRNQTTATTVVLVDYGMTGAKSEL